MHQQQRKWMSRGKSQLIPLFCLVLCICIGCNSSSLVKSQTGDCKPVEHALGESCIPQTPQRVVVVDEIALDAVLALNMKPIAAAEPTLVGPRARHLTHSLDGIVSIGRESEPSLERLVELNPDLILGFSSAKTHYNSLSKIAPTVAFNYEHDNWKAELESIGEMLGKSNRAQQQLANYNKRVAEFRAAMGNKLESTKVSVIRFTEATQNTHYRTVTSFPGSVLQDVGLPRPIAQQQPTDQPYGDVSLERMDLLDGDVIFAMLDPRSGETFQQFQSHPLWQTLNAVKTNRVYQVDSGYWSFGNLLAANAILDDLFRYLLPVNQS